MPHSLLQWAAWRNVAHFQKEKKSQCTHIASESTCLATEDLTISNIEKQ